MVELPRTIQEPREGHYAIRLRTKGPRVPAKLELSEGRWQLTINQILQSETYLDSDVSDLIALTIMAGSMFDHPFVRVLTFGRAITEQEYNEMVERIEWAKKYRPDDPCLHPTEPIDLGTMDSLW